MAKGGKGTPKSGRGCKGIPKGGMGAKGILRPQLWKSGPDPVLHEIYCAYNLAKAQYNFRLKHGLDNGAWLVSYKEYAKLWEGKWQFRGRASNDLCHSRKDWEKDWTYSNMEIIPRSEHHRRQAANRPPSKWGQNKMRDHQERMKAKR